MINFNKLIQAYLSYISKNGIKELNNIDFLSLFKSDCKLLIYNNKYCIFHEGAVSFMFDIPSDTATASDNSFRADTANFIYYTILDNINDCNFSIFEKSDDYILSYTWPYQYIINDTSKYIYIYSHEGYSKSRLLKDYKITYNHIYVLNYKDYKWIKHIILDFLWNTYIGDDLNIYSSDLLERIKCIRFMESL